MVKFKNFSFQYALGDKPALKNINLELAEGKINIICGKSGCGKTTLLKLIMEDIAPAGQSDGEKISSLSPMEMAYVFQNPDTSQVCSTVLGDLAFQMENMGLNRDTMKKRMAETVGFFGIENLLRKNGDSISGGQKQLVSLCSALMTYPRLLILDEPLSQLDPIASADFMDMVSRINSEFSVTVLMSAQNLGDCIAYAHKLGVMEDGRLPLWGNPDDVLKKIWEEIPSLTFLIPDLTKAGLKLFQKALFTPNKLKSLLDTVALSFSPKEMSRNRLQKPYGAEIINVAFSYPQSQRPVLSRLNAKFEKGKLTCLLGGNGSGKTTLLKLMSGIYRNFNGKIKKPLNTAYMPQNIYSYISRETVREEIVFPGCDTEYYAYLINALGIAHIEAFHPFDISTGEASKVVLASILMRKPELLLLDEPVKGLDGSSKEAAAALLKDIGQTVIMTTHDLDFAARHASYCCFLFNGEVAYEGTPREFFMENRYYTTAINKAFRHISGDIINLEDVISL